MAAKKWNQMRASGCGACGNFFCWEKFHLVVKATYHDFKTNKRMNKRKNGQRLNLLCWESKHVLKTDLSWQYTIAICHSSFVITSTALRTYHWFIFVLPILCFIQVKGGTAAAMGSTSSRIIDYTKYTNDYELVIRVSKALDQELTQKFGIDGEGLTDKINNLKHRYSNYGGGSSSTIIMINPWVVSNMKRLVYLRNQLVHEYHIHSLQDLGTSRSQFCNDFAEAQKELLRVKKLVVEEEERRRKASTATSQNDSVCIVS